MSEAYPSVTVSIVSHGQWAMVRPLVDQLHARCRSSIARIVLTVNIPEATDVPAHWDLPLDIVRNAEPRGFGANHNAAFARCDSAWFLVLNPDIRLDDNVIATLLARAKQQTGLITPRIQEPGKSEPEPYRDLLTPLELFRRRSPSHRPPQQPVWVAGMFMQLRREAFAQIGGFDERFFMYCEDFDLCARLRLGGWDLQVEEDLSVLHDARRASNSSFKPLLWHLASFARVWTSPAFWRYVALMRRDRAEA